MRILRETAASWGLILQPAQLELFECYYHELIEWNRRLNLTRITDYEAVQVRHFLDSLAVLKGMEGIAAAHRARLVDVGAGPGLPGLALKIACPELRLTLVEAVAKKAEFLRHVVNELRLRDVEVVADRAERLARQPGYRESFTFAVARALADLPVTLELTLPFVEVGGRAILPRKGNMAAQVAEAQVAMSLLGGRHLATIPLHLPGEEDDRGLVVVEKIAPTDQRYPRRPGIPAKRPLR